MRARSTSDIRFSTPSSATERKCFPMMFLLGLERGKVGLSRACRQKDTATAFRIPNSNRNLMIFVTTQHCDEWAQCCTVGRERSSMIYYDKGYGEAASILQ